MNHPAPLRRIPVMIGGGGERKTLRLVAQYADESNLICAPADIPRKLEVLADHCATLGRDRSEITVSYLTSACIAPTHDEAVADFENYLSRQPEAGARRVGTILGSPDEVAEEFSRLRDAGIDGVTVNAPANGHVEGRVALLGETLAPLFIR
jgi:alkanesulfonate monooxygenase SsuD/methylene tetrahydromethanopterin reductase-like flavin-dependent oxidoreductase (luciferase family)